MQDARPERARRQRREDAALRPVGHGQPEHGAGDRDDARLQQELADELSARRAQRQANGGFARARQRARQLQVRDVGAGDEEHEEGHREQQLQGLAALLAQLSRGRSHRASARSSSPDTS